MSDAEIIRQTAQSIHGQLSEGTIIAIVTGAVTFLTSLLGFLTLWLRLRYGVAKTEEAVATGHVVKASLDTNTAITQQAKEHAEKASEHTEACDVERQKMLASLMDHDKRISALEGKIESVNKNIDSTRHEMRGHLQTLTTKLDILTVMNGQTEQKQ